ncbi:MAG: HAD-IA family hydrolase [Betaproteobacteria bacterium]
MAQSGQRYDLIVFDWDGTIMDSTGLIADSIQLAAREMRLPVPTLEQAKSIIGLGINDSTRRLFPQLDASAQTRFALTYRKYFVARDHEAPLYDGIRELLSSLASPQRFLAVATGKPRAGLERAFGHTGLKSHFHYSRCGDEGFPKPHPDMLRRLMDFSAVEPDRTLMIGDTTHDLELAQNAGVDALAVTYGAHPRAALAGLPARDIVDSVDELSRWIRTNA